MNSRIRLAGSFMALAAVGGLVSCKDPTMPAVPASAAQESSAGLNVFEDCPAPALWFPDGGVTPPVEQFEPLPHPDTECPFYRGAYQNFLIATQPKSNGDPALVDLPTIDDAFTSLTAHPPRNTAGWAWLGAVEQAGFRNVLVDQDEHTLYYGIHMNQAFVDFIKANHLDTVQGITSVNPYLTFPPGLVEYKTAWKDIDKADFPGGVVTPPGGGDPGDYSTYITTMAYLPTLTQDASGRIVEHPDQPRLRRVALVALHSVYTLPGHPEFVWGSVQHVNLNGVDNTSTVVQSQGQTGPDGGPQVVVYGVADCQPDTLALPLTDAGLPGLVNAEISTPLSNENFLLYKGGTPENQANHPCANLVLDVDAQTFPGQAESVYRMFPGSKSQQLGPDTAILSLNANLTQIAKGLIAAKSPDKRLYYHLVAAVWMDKPALFGLGPDGQGMSLQNDDGTNPLLLAAVNGGPDSLHPELNQGTFCGTPLAPLDAGGGSGDLPGTLNTVPGCVTRQDVLAAGPANDPAGTITTDLTLNGTDSPFSILGGEDRLSSTSMETFTQFAGPKNISAFPNCFACHNTQPISSQGVPVSKSAGQQVIIAKPAMINVSHLFSEFVARELDAHPGLLDANGNLDARVVSAAMTAPRATSPGSSGSSSRADAGVPDASAGH